MDKLDTLEKIYNQILAITDTAVELFKVALKQPHAVTLLGIAMAAFILLLLIRKIKRAFRPIKLFDNRAGVVFVSRKALDELVQSVCYSLGALNRPDVKISTRRGKLCMNVSLKLESGQKLTDATEQIQTALTSAFREHLGVEKLGTIDVRIIGFKGLIYKPTTKFLPSPEPKDDDILLSDSSSPVFDAIDDAKPAIEVKEQK